MAESKNLRDLSEEELRRVIDRQAFLKNLVGPEGITYDSYYNNISESEWWFKHLWAYLGLIDYSEPDPEKMSLDFEIETWADKKGEVIE